MIGGMRRAGRILSVTLVTAGLVILADAGLTLAWKEPLSTIYGSLQQRQAASELDSVRDDFLELPGAAALSGEGSDPVDRAERLADLFASELNQGEPIGRIEIPSVDAGYVVIEGTSTADLRRGPGHYRETALPGQGSTIGIAGHRTTYQAPFRRINDIQNDDRIVLEMPYGEFTYEVTETRIVEPTRTEIVRDIGRERLVLTACHPLYSAAQRYAVFADLVAAEPAAAGGG